MRSTALLTGLLLSSTAIAAPRGGRGGSQELRPYVPPRLDPEPPLAAADVQVVEARDGLELVVQARPAAGAPMVGSAVAGARLRVRGLFEAASSRGCAGRRWYALEPFGWVCAGLVRATPQPPTTEAVLQVPDGKRLPYQYLTVGVEEGEQVPLWASAEELQAGADPILQLAKGDSIALKYGATPLRLDGETFLVAADGRVLPIGHTARMGEGSAWQGMALNAETPLPFAWVTPEAAKVYAGPEERAAVVETLPRRTRVTILEEAGQGRARRLRIGDGRWMRPADLNEARLLPRPPGTESSDRWIDVDLGEQVLVAYEGARPVFTTLVSSGRAFPTPRGNYPIWGKVSQITMKSQPYEDKTYYVDRVPWVLFFQAHNAIHGAYWHDRFGVAKSHGCVNLAPLDARWIFEWVPPALPAAWSGLRTPNLLQGAVTVHVRNSAVRRPFVQERPIGPPDREEEQLKLAEAEARRTGLPAVGALATTPGTPLPPPGASPLPGASHAPLPPPAGPQPPALLPPAGSTPPALLPPAGPHPAPPAGAAPSPGAAPRTGAPLPVAR